MDLVRKSLDVVRDFERLFELLDSRDILVLRCQQGKRDGEALGVGRVDHGGMGGRGGCEGVGGSLDGEGNDFAAPAVLLGCVRVSFLRGL